MGRAVRWIAWTLAALSGTALLLFALLWVAANIQPGRHLIERMVAAFSAGEVSIAGLSGRFPDALRIARIEVRDDAGAWLTIDKLQLDWSPSRLLAGVADIDRLQAEQFAVLRPPAASPAPSPAPSGTHFQNLPIGVVLRDLRVQRLDLAPALAGAATTLAIDGSVRLDAYDRGRVELRLQRLDTEGTYSLQADMDPGMLQARLNLREPAHGFLSSVAGLPQLGAVALDATLAGPRASVRTQLALEAGPLHAAIQGSLDLPHEAADLSLTASAPAMSPRPDLSWQAIALDAQVQGQLEKPSGKGVLRIDALRVADTAIHSIAVKLQGNGEAVNMVAELDGLRIPGPRPELFQAAPLILRADARLDRPDRPLVFSLQHPLLKAEGKAATAGDMHGELLLNLPDLAPFAAVAGDDVQGHMDLRLRAALRGDAIGVDADSKLGITGGKTPLRLLLGSDAKIVVAVTRQGQDIRLSRLQLDGRALSVSAQGGLGEKSADLGWQVRLSDLAAVAPTVSGRLSMQGQLAGPRDQLAVNAELNGELATRGMPPGPIAAKLRAQGLPLAPTGQLTAHGVLDGGALKLALSAQQDANAALHVSIDAADWKSVHGEGALTLPKGGHIPVGKVDLRMSRLEDLRRLLGQPLSGGVSVTLVSTAQGARQRGHLRLDARAAGQLGSVSVGQAVLAVGVDDPSGQPRVDGRLTVDDVTAEATSGSARLEVAGTKAALDLRLSANARTQAAAETRLVAAARLDIPAKTVAVSELQADWKNETLRLLAPAGIGFADGVTVERLRLGLRQAVLEADGRATPVLDLRLALHNVPADLIGLFAPGAAADGTLQAEAKLTGAPAHPSGAVSVDVSGLHMRSGPGRALPPAKLTATAELNGSSAQIDSRMNAGSGTSLAVTGVVPLVQSGPLDLHAAGDFDLRLLNPLLAANGQRLLGQVSLNAGLAGTLAGPRVTGTMQLADGELQDYVQGAHLTHITALLQADGDTIRIARFEGRAGAGTISASGKVSVLAAGMPVDLTATARNARLLSSDRLSVDLNADLTVRGQAKGQLASSGTIHLNRAEIRIPERMPASTPVLELVGPGAPPPSPPPSPSADIALNLTIEAPNQVFVRGRGLDAELGGTVRVHGTAAEPQPDGRFELRRGWFSLAGKTLTFSKGVVDFNGGSLTDPTLDFVASLTNANVTANLNVGGSASKPKITLSSVPELPQDEVLAHLLFGHGTATLSPFELAQIAAAVASLTGVTSGAGDPLESMRKGLGLDRLSVGGGQGGAPTLEAGRYVAPGVYVGTKQGATGTTNTQATVQVDIGKGLKLEGSAGSGSSSGSGSGSGGNSIGVTYQFEY